MSDSQGKGGGGVWQRKPGVQNPDDLGLRSALHLLCGLDYISESLSGSISSTVQWVQNACPSTLRTFTNWNARHKDQLSKHHGAVNMTVMNGGRLRGGRGEAVVAWTLIPRARAPQPGPGSLGSGVEAASAGIAGTLSPPGGHRLQVLPPHLPSGSLLHRVGG